MEGGERRLESEENASLASWLLLLLVFGEVSTALVSIFGVPLAISAKGSPSVASPTVSAPVAVAAACSNSNGLRSNKSESKSNLIESKSQKISFSTRRFSIVTSVQMCALVFFCLCGKVFVFVLMYNVSFRRDEKRGRGMVFTYKERKQFDELIRTFFV